MTVLRLVVAGILLAAAVSKLRDRTAVSHRLGTVRTSLLIGVEAGLAAWLASGVAPRAAGLAATALFAAFAVHLVLARARGARRLPCNCFGAGAERPAWLLIARALASRRWRRWWRWPRRRPRATTLLVAAVALLTLAVVALAVLVLALYRQVGVLELRIAPRQPSSSRTRAPDSAPTPGVRGARPRGEELVAFLGAGCRVCHELEPSLRALRARGDVGCLVFDIEDEERDPALGGPGTPFVVAVTDGRVVAKGTVNTLEEIEGLIAIGRAARRADCLIRADLAARLAASGTRRSFLARVGAALFAVVGGKMVAAAVSPEEAQSFHFCGHTSRPAPARARTGCRASTATGCRCAPPTAARSTTSAGWSTPHGLPVDERGRRLLGPDGAPLPRAPRTRICEDWVPERYGVDADAQGSWYRCCDGRVRRSWTAARLAEAHQRRRGAARLLRKTHHVFCVMYQDSDVPC